ncbi:peptidoglycan-associated lipoprotein [Mergibacter septicus]|uniref:Peptidoglycan-associated lipoprotein n=1 Tax=Mergibacter septicus TaxID=221402 RepID=A0A8D4IWN9_9PAST|nr:peptidoglycan-associated lipoprotein Pal [Mergibacter septicus]AWX14771.1 peptidoglycan-associated lipoprotein [Mergibacter septicus]QDJ14022.1 peptidoglycan-associated lipoprotein [Mergibacter septicus]UTU48530.1 peptidoglycan-associated lipoprotein Pal [Mergibacter septicus]WMR95841.1 peptidoglycan-associated lipoprotein Pal [Mergibacter septicus]
MKKLAKALILTAPILFLSACSNQLTQKNADNSQNQLYQGMTATELQQRYNTVYFGFDKFDVDPQYNQLLDAQAQYLLQSAKNVVIEGHTDPRGTPEYNIALGQRRADAVKNYLSQKGVPNNQLSTLSYGEEKPAVLGNSEADYAKDRRAVLAYY